MPPSDPLVSVCLPVRNGEHRLEPVVRSVLAQSHANLELVISDNASTDGTEDLCRTLAKDDARIVYHRQPENVGIINNFVSAVRRANGMYVRWIGDDDWLAPDCVSRCLDRFAADDRLVVVTMRLEYELPDGTTQSARYDGTALGSADPVDRFAEVLRLLNESYLLLDPLYGLMRRATVVDLPRRIMLREDEVFAARLALAGPWAHVPDVLARRGWKYETPQVLARRLGVPAWQARLAHLLEAQELLRWVRVADLDPRQRRRARAAVARLVASRYGRGAVNRARRAARRISAGTRRKPVSSRP